MGEPIKLHKQENLVEIHLNRPDAYNALNLEMLTELAKILTELATIGVPMNASSIAWIIIGFNSMTSHCILSISRE
jgi:1,4-dihydroxy-2-naphthoyl-CoA synthase